MSTRELYAKASPHRLALQVVAGEGFEPSKAEPPYKPETTLLCVRLRSRNAIALISAPR